jgi:hypothetical protein
MTSFKTDTLIYSVNDSGTAVFRDSNTLGYIFINTGNCPVLLNNYLLLPSSTFKTFEPTCIDMTLYRMIFKPANFFYPACGEEMGSLTVIIYNKV